MNVYELTNRFDRRKSFYGKAHVKETKSKYILQSYNTEILSVEKDSKKITFITKSAYDLTQTTLRHVREFLKQFTDDFSPRSKREFIKLMEKQQ